MSIGIYIDCDGCGEVPMARPTARQCREDMKSEGWHVNRPGGRDICPECWARGER